MTKLFIPILLGTAREGRESAKVARYILSQVEKSAKFETQFVDIADFLFARTAVYPDAAKPWREIMSRADGLIIVSPEYNRGIPGELKILLDSLEEEYDKKPVAVVGVSSGTFGGVRMAEHILPTLVYLGMVPMSTYLTFPVAQKLFDQNCTILDSTYDNKVLKMIEELTWFADVFKRSRIK